MKIWRNELSPAITDVLTGYEIKASPPGDPVYVRINNSLIHFELANLYAYKKAVTYPRARSRMTAR